MTQIDIVYNSDSNRFRDMVNTKLQEIDEMGGTAVRTQFSVEDHPKFNKVWFCYITYVIDPKKLLGKVVTK